MQLVEKGADAMTAPRKRGFLQTLRAVLWGFFGVRKRAGYERDAQQLNPVHVILAGIIAAVIFVLTLVTIVHFVVN